MGSLFSTPSTPTYSPVSYVVPSTSVNATTITTDNSTENDTTDTDTETVQDVIGRVARGRSSTIQTSFRGVLGDSNSLAPQRKTLLGE